MTIQSLELKKVPGIDAVTAEMLQAGRNSTANVLIYLFFAIIC